MSHEKIAIIYQSCPPPERNGIAKPMKPGGYSDSGADIAYALTTRNIQIITPVDNPDIQNDFDWVFPDTHDGIQSAIDKGASVIWLNTVLYKGHPIESFIEDGISVIGQIPSNTDIYDDKLAANILMKQNHLPIPKFVMITAEGFETVDIDVSFPVVAKPIRGRGSQGVTFVESESELVMILKDMFESQDYGNALYVEEYLPGEEVTISVMPPGTYTIHDQTIVKEDYWSLPPVRRFNHHNGIAPYNGVVAVIENSQVLDDDRINSPEMKQLCRQCEIAAKLVNAKATIRIDCRANDQGQYFLFDLNMKPNMTGPSRPHRLNQDSLTAMAAQKIGWTFDALILNMMHQHWKKA